jgi:HD-GYP domain-containing protein (c-di-GMP phosphodiesterase class II)
MAVKTRRVKRLHIALSALMLAMMMLFYAGLASVTLYMGAKNDLAASRDIVQRVSRELGGVFAAETRPIESAVVVLSETSMATGKRHEERMAQISSMAAALKNNPSSTSVYIGTVNGSFSMLRKLNTPADRKTFMPPEGAEYLLQSVNRDKGPAVGRFYFYDAALNLMSTVAKPDYQFDPRTRPWYQLASSTESADKVIETAPYVFASNQKIGITFATRNAARTGVVGMDITLGSMSRLIAKQRVTPSAEMVVFNQAGTVIAYRDVKRMFRTIEPGKREVVTVPALTVPALTLMYAHWKNQPKRDPNVDVETKVQVRGEEWHSNVIKIRDSGGQSLYLGICAPKSELMANSIHIRNLTFLTSLFIMALMIPAVHFGSRIIARPIRNLAKVANAIERFEFGDPDPAPCNIIEIDDLARAMTSMKHTHKRFLDISSALAAESSFDRLINIILHETISVAGATSGTMALVSPDGTSLQVVARQLKGEAQDITNASSYELASVDTSPLEVKAVVEGALQSVRIRRSNPEQAAVYASLLDLHDTDQLHMIAVPLRNRADEVIGALSLSLKAPDDESSEGISPTLLAFIEALSGTAAVAIDNQKMILDQKLLFERVIKFVAGMIDAKSPYHGGHCERVPELAKMLARTACAQTEGVFAEYTLSEDEWDALHIAGLLHDCGKVATPEYVVDKATKLETIYDRINEVRMRFEVVKRDVEIELFRRAVAGLPTDRVDVAALDAEIKRAHGVLDEEFHFIASCNVGSEFMAKDKLERLKTIAQRRWLRTLSNRTGISQEELTRKESDGIESLPVWEDLLADKPEHIVPRPERERLDNDDSWEFKISQPDSLYNRGEVYNLSIGRGTLTDEERYKINEHIVQTIKMLSHLPFPKQLRRVPEIAGCHHEKLDGTGYPRCLQKDNMSTEARIMAIADVFEALTAFDRPYKKGKTLSEAVKIMSFMSKDGHIDPDLFELFLKSGAYLEYANRYMRPEQIDTVDVQFMA